MNQPDYAHMSTAPVITTAPLTFMVAGSRSGVGKTTVVSCLIALLAEAGKRVRTFKLGPDFIDAGRHTLLAGSPCLTLDRFLCTPPDREAEADMLLLDRFRTAILGYDVVIIEAVGGLYDDWDGTGDSPADIAKILGIPVLLVCDGRSSCQTAGIEAGALMSADPELDVIGVVFPEVSSDEHLKRIVKGIPQSLADRLFLMLPACDALKVEERHLGLVTAAEGCLDSVSIAAAARPCIPVSEILTAVEKIREGKYTTGDRQDEPFPRTVDRASGSAAQSEKFRLALARDEAFSFYYPDNIKALEAAGACIVPFSPLHDSRLPDADLIILGGGFPELYADALADNTTMRESIQEAAQSGMPIYAECGGLIYLSSSIGKPDGGSRDGVGVFPFATRFDRLIIGYLEIEIESDCLLGPAGTKARGHVFHRSAVVSGIDVECVFSFFRRGDSLRDDLKEGYRIGNVLSTWVHIHFASAPSMPLALARAALTWH